MGTTTVTWTRGDMGTPPPQLIPTNFLIPRRLALTSMLRINSGLLSLYLQEVFSAVYDQSGRHTNLAPVGYGSRPFFEAAVSACG